MTSPENLALISSHSKMKSVLMFRDHLMKECLKNYMSGDRTQMFDDAGANTLH